LLIRHSTVPYCQKYTPADCFFGDFAHWEEITKKEEFIIIQWIDRYYLSAYLLLKAPRNVQ